MYGFDPNTSLRAFCLPPPNSTMTVQDYAKAHKEDLRRAYDLARAHMSEAARNAKINYDRHHRPTQFQVNQLVKLKTHGKSYADAGVTKKLLPLYTAPYRIMRKLSEVTYRVKNTADPADKRTVNIADMDTYFHPKTMDKYGLPDVRDNPPLHADDSSSDEDDAATDPSSQTFTNFGRATR